MKKFSILLVALAAFSLSFAEESDKVRHFYEKQYQQALLDRDFLQAYSVLNKMERKLADEDFSGQKASVQDSIFAVAIYSQENFNADKAVEYLQFYLLKFDDKKLQIYQKLAQIYRQAGEQDTAQSFWQKAQALRE